MVIEIASLKKTYKKSFRRIEVLKGLHLTIDGNRIVGLLGPNGAGKTTLLKLITGISWADSGTIRLFGSEDLAEGRRRIGFLPESPQFFRNITARELLSLSRSVSGRPVPPERLDRVLEYVRLAPDGDHRIGTFSRGMVQRIGIAQAIIHEPDLLILDEPMSGLDPLGRRLVAEIITRYHQEGKSILFSTHHLDDIDTLCTDVVVIRDGEISYQDTISKLRRQSRFYIEAEHQGRTVVYTPENDQKMWQVMTEIRIREMRIIRMKSGISQILENYYEQKNQSIDPGPVA
jgi:ABC-2 type transport system ATP-binding protein